jgi:hypothetical protein
MSKRHLGILFIILGLLLAAISLSADLLGIGNGAGFGWKQILGTVVGVLIALGGIWWGWGNTGAKKISYIQ